MDACVLRGVNAETLCRIRKKLVSKADTGDAHRTAIADPIATANDDRVHSFAEGGLKMS